MSHCVGVLQSLHHSMHIWGLPPAWLALGTRAGAVTADSQMPVPVSPPFLLYVPEQLWSVKFSERARLSLQFLDLEFVNYDSSGTSVRLRSFFISDIWKTLLFFNIRKLHKVIVTLVDSLVFYSQPCKLFVFFGAFSNFSCINCTRSSQAGVAVGTSS